MKKLLITLFFLIISGNVFGENSINVPYEEYKQLLKESIKKEVMDGIDAAPFIYNIDTAFYKMTIKPGGASCMATLSGATISGEPVPFTIFNNKIIIENIIQVSGGSLLCNQDNKKGIEFLPSKKDRFSIKLSLFIPAGEDNRSRIISLAIPGALKNSIVPVPTKKIVLTEVPGIKNSSGIYNFSSRPSLTIRYTNKKKIGEKSKSIAKSKALSTRYKTVDSPPIILDSVTCFTSFEESGNILSVLMMKVPPEAGDHFKIRSIPDTSIWSLKVNGKKMKVYTSGDTDDYWILPLAKGKSSNIELAMLRKGKKIGLHGRLELSLPKMKLPSRKVNIAIGLPPRVQLMSFEGSVAPDSKFNLKAPEEFIGKPYYFSRSFYKGEGINIAVSYKEPVNQ